MTDKITYEGLRQTKLLTKVSATVLASWFGMGTFSVLLSLSECIMFPALERGIGSRISIDTLSIGSPTRY